MSRLYLLFMFQISPVSMVAYVSCDSKCDVQSLAWNAGQDVFRMKKPFTALTEGKGSFSSNKYLLV